MHPKLIITFLFGAIILGTIFFCTLLVTDGEKERLTSVVILFFGIALGWLFGILVSPYGGKERAIFAKYLGVVSTFISGYILAKMDSAILYLLSPEVLFTKLVGVRIISTLSVAIFTTIIVFAARKYWRERKQVGS